MKKLFFKLCLVLGVSMGFLVPLSTAHAEAFFNTDLRDTPLLRAYNFTHNPHCGTCWSDDVSARFGEVIEFSIFYHNTSQEVARNTRIRLNIPYQEFSFQIAAASVWSENARTRSGNTMIRLQERQYLTLIPDSVWWYPDDSSFSRALPDGQSGLEIVNGGIAIGDVGSGNKGVVTARFLVIDRNDAFSGSSTRNESSSLSSGAEQGAPPQSNTILSRVNPFAPVLAVAKKVFEKPEELVNVRVQADPREVKRAEESEIKIWYQNKGSAPITNARLEIALPSEIEYIHFSKTPFTFDGDARIIYSLGRVDPDGGEEIVLRVRMGRNADERVPVDVDLYYANYRNEKKSVSDNVEIAVLPDSHLLASLSELLQPIFGHWFRYVFLGLLAGFSIAYYFFGRTA